MPLSKIITISLDSELAEQLKELAEQENRSLSNYIETRLRELIAATPQRSK